MKKSNFKLKIGSKINDNKRNFVVLDMEYRIKKKKRNNKYINANLRYYKLRCNTCGWDNLHIEEWGLLNGKGCSCCSGHTVVEGINDIPTTAPWMVKYFQGGYDEAKLYGRGSHKQLHFKCPDCNRISDNKVAINNLFKNHSISCKCSDGVSYPNKFIYNFIQQLESQISYFKTEYSPDWIKPKRYDMYFEINNEKYIVEMDGGLGHGNKSQYSSHNISIYNYDELKDVSASNHNIKIIRVDCNPSIYKHIKENIINSKLNGILNLDIVDWEKCDKDSCKNIMKEICIYKKENKFATTIDISKIYARHPSTINSYLNNGSRLGWCEYNPKEDNIRKTREVSFKRRKRVICLTTNELFLSAQDVTICYQGLTSKSIQKCCQGSRKSTGKDKLMFRYFDELNDDISSFLLPNIKQSA